MRKEDIKTREPAEIGAIREGLDRMTNEGAFKNSGMIPVDYDLYLEGVGFFPYGSGLWFCAQDSCGGVDVLPCRRKESLLRSRPPFPVGNYMILGQDFGDQDNFKDMKETAIKKRVPWQCELIRGNPTWRNLIKVLNGSDISARDCFFTNAFMGLRAGVGNRTGEAPPFQPANKGGSTFRNRCYELFLTQVKELRPAAIICLGRNVLRFLKEGSAAIDPTGDLAVKLAGFSPYDNYKDIHEEFQILHDVAISRVDKSIKPNIVLIAHPSTPNHKARGVEMNADVDRIKSIIVI